MSDFYYKSDLYTKSESASLFVQKTGDAMTGNLTTSGDIEARDIIATDAVHVDGYLLVGSTNILNAITDLQNNAGGNVDTSLFVQKTGDATTGN